MTPSPLVSCLCVTRNRVDLLKRSVGCFLTQTYAHKELIILCEDDDRETIDYLSKVNHPAISHCIIPVQPKKKLGDLRNIILEKSKGEYFCQWDDDDWYHCERIQRQVSAAVENHHPGSILTNWVIFDELYKCAYFSRIRWWEGSILFQKEVLTKKGIRYPAMEKGEDTVFTQEIVNRSRIFPMVSPPIYVYTYHGKNTWDRLQFEDNFKLSQKLSDSTSNLIRKILAGDYSNEEASKLIMGKEILEEINFFHFFKTTPSTTQRNVSSVR